MKCDHIAHNRDMKYLFRYLGLDAVHKLHIGEVGVNKHNWARSKEETEYDPWLPIEEWIVEVISRTPYLVRAV